MVDKAIIDFLIEFHAKRDYFECHEILEDRWKADAKANRKLYFVALIQLAVGQYHYRRHNLTGAMKMLERSKEKIRQTTADLEAVGIDVADLLNLLVRQINAIKQDCLYEPITIPMDQKLLDECLIKCQEQGLKFFNQEKSVEDRLINKHLPKYRKG